MEQDRTPKQNNFLERIFWKISSLLKIDAVLVVFLGDTSYLVKEGWFKSAWRRKSIDKDGKPLPWLTYPLIHFLEPKLNRNLQMFEYGCGNSTKWFADRVGHIVSVEHDAGWYKMVKEELPSNAELVLETVNADLDYSTITFLSADDKSDYSLSITKTGDLYDIILVDGIYRNNSVVNAANCLKKEGVIILDNSDFDESKQAAAYLGGLGFRRLDFWGMCPIVSHKSCTSIFYRNNNCLII
jgi:hypothetical protein